MTDGTSGAIIETLVHSNAPFTSPLSTNPSAVYYRSGEPHCNISGVIVTVKISREAKAEARLDSPQFPQLFADVLPMSSIYGIASGGTVALAQPVTIMEEMVSESVYGSDQWTPIPEIEDSEKTEMRKRLWKYESIVVDLKVEVATLKATVAREKIRADQATKAYFYRNGPDVLDEGEDTWGYRSRVDED